MTALQIASLKKVNKRSQVLLLDKNGGVSKIIAKELGRKGFKKIRVIQVRRHSTICHSSSAVFSAHLLQ